MAKQKKISTYHRLKQENEKLKDQLHKLVMFPDSPEATLIKMSIKLNADFEKAIWAGSPTKITDDAGVNGFTVNIPLIDKKDYNGNR